jgi:hypothetical protein
MGAEIALSLQTTYAELLERCATADFEDAFPEDGIFTPKTVRGRKYWYFQTKANGKRPQRYVGPETEELLARIAKHRQTRNDQKERQALVSTLVRSAHLPRPDAVVGEVLGALAKAGVFRLRSVLVGTIAFQTYAAMLGTRLPLTAIRTGDVDIAQDRAISVAIEDATPPMLEILQKVDASFRPIPHLHDSRRATRYETGKGLRVDFLTPNRGRNSDKPMALPALRTDAEQLRFLDYLIYEPEWAVVLHGTGIYVKVPAPQRYALHKLIVAERRLIGSGKNRKDFLQAEVLLQVLARQRPHDLRTTWEEAYGRGAKWGQLMLASLGMIDPIVRDETLITAGLPRSALPGLTLRFDAVPPRYDWERDIATFTGVAGGHAVRCAISREALDDHFGADGLDQKGRLEQFRKNRDIIEEMARIKYLEWPVEEPGSVLLKTLDVDKLKKHVRKKSGGNSR